MTNTNIMVIYNTLQNIREKYGIVQHLNYFTTKHFKQSNKNKINNTYYIFTISMATSYKHTRRVC